MMAEGTHQSELEIVASELRSLQDQMSGMEEQMASMEAMLRQFLRDEFGQDLEEWKLSESASICEAQSESGVVFEVNKSATAMEEEPKHSNPEERFEPCGGFSLDIGSDGDLEDESRSEVVMLEVATQESLLDVVQADEVIKDHSHIETNAMLSDSEAILSEVYDGHGNAEVFGFNDIVSATDEFMNFVRETFGKNPLIANEVKKYKNSIHIQNNVLISVFEESFYAGAGCNNHIICSLSLTEVKLRSWELDGLICVLIHDPGGFLSIICFLSNCMIHFHHIDNLIYLEMISKCLRKCYTESVLTEQQNKQVIAIVIEFGEVLLGILQQWFGIHSYISWEFALLMILVFVTFREEIIATVFTFHFNAHTIGYEYESEHAVNGWFQSDKGKDFDYCGVVFIVHSTCLWKYHTQMMGQKIFSLLFEGDSYVPKRKVLNIDLGSFELAVISIHQENLDAYGMDTIFDYGVHTYSVIIPLILQVFAFGHMEAYSINKFLEMVIIFNFDPGINNFSCIMIYHVIHFNALVRLESMLWQGLEPDEVSMVIQLVHEVGELYKEMIGHALLSDVIVYGILINAFVDVGSVKEVINNVEDKVCGSMVTEQQPYIMIIPIELFLVECEWGHVMEKNASMTQDLIHIFHLLHDFIIGEKQIQMGVSIDQRGNSFFPKIPACKLGNFQVIYDSMGHVTLGSLLRNRIVIVDKTIILVFYLGGSNLDLPPFGNSSSFQIYYCYGKLLQYENNGHLMLCDYLLWLKVDYGAGLLCIYKACNLVFFGLNLEDKVVLKGRVIDMNKTIDMGK